MTAPVLPSDRATVERLGTRLTARTLAAPGIAVGLAAVLLGIYLSLAAMSLGLGRLTAIGIFLFVVSGMVALWLRLPPVDGDHGRGGRTICLARQAVPFFAFFTAGVLAPEFAFGSPGLGRIGMVLGTCLVLFLVIRSQLSGRTEGLWAWIERHSGALTLALVSVHLIITTALVVIRHYSYNPVLGEDTGYYNQIFWSTFQGEFFRGSLTQARYSNPPINSEFGAHNSPILFLLLPAYWVHPSFYTLLVLRNIALSASALPIFFLAKARLGGTVALGLAASYLLNSNILYQSVGAFYPLQFSAIFLVLAFLFFDRARFPLFMAFFLLALLVREEIALTAVIFGVYALLLRRSWRWVITPTVISIIWWFVSVHLIMVPSRIALEDLEEFYQVFPNGFSSAPGVLLRRPVEFLRLILSAENMPYLYKMVKSTAGMALATPAILFALPVILINLIVGAFWKATTSIDMHYSLVASVCLSIASVYGLAQLSRLHRLFHIGQRAFALTLVFLLAPPALVGIKDIVSYGAGPNQTLLSDFLPRPYGATLDHIAQVIESDPKAAVAAPGILLPRLSKRRELYNSDRLWRYGSPRLDYIVVNDPRYLNTSERQGTRHFAQYEALLAEINVNPAYRLLLDENGFRLYRVEQRLLPTERES
jgi:uncharacterized membrane protein